ncbi:MAG: hypothetical protein M0P58_13290, partial [Bacteroidales bacterium]|nr:hypothetical protein [Bacteroidales bacterium]
MKNLLLPVILVITTLFASAQTYRAFDTPQGKGYLIKSKDGKCAFVQYNSRRENVTPEIKFLNSEFQKEESGQFEKKTYKKNRTTHHLTLYFDKDMTMGGEIYIASDSISFTPWDITLSPDGLSGEIDLPEDSYEIIATYTDWQITHDLSYAIIHNLNITENVDTTISFDNMANHKVFMQCKDENGTVIDPVDPAFIQKSVNIDLELPSNCSLTGLIISASDIPNGYIKFSDIDTSYKIVINQFNVRHSKLYSTDMGQLNGLTKDTVLINDPSAYNKMDMVMHASPSSGDNYLTFENGNITNFGGLYMLYMSGPFPSENYPSFDKDTLHVFLGNRAKPENHLVAFVADVQYWEELPTFWPMENRKKTISDPFFISTEDSIVFTRCNVSSATPHFPNNSIINLGNASPYTFINGSNNRMGANTIFSSNNIYGEINEDRQMDRLLSMYEIRRGNEILVSDLLYEFTNPFAVSEPGIYSFVVTDNNFSIQNQPGQSMLTSTFDLNNQDANSPVISSFKLLNPENLISNTFKSDKPGKIELNSFDYNFTSHQMNTPASVQVFYKKYEDSEWIPLNVVTHPSLFDSINYGGFYTCDLASAFSQFTTSGYLDLKLVVMDNSDNTTTHTWRPAAYVEVNKPWNYTITGMVHTISVPNTANPNIYGQPLEPGDWVGVFYTDDNGNEACGGAAMIDAQGNAVVMAYGDDPTTGAKDGFESGEAFRWKLYDASTQTSYDA